MDWERRQMDALAAGTWVAPSEAAITVGEWVERWWQERRPVKPSTATRYESLLRLHLLPEWRRRPLSSVAPSEVQGWATRLVATRSVSTARQAVGLLRQAFDAAVADGRLARNPALSVRLPRAPRSEPSPLTHDQVWRLVDTVQHERDKVLVLVMAYGGLRWSEAVGLRVRDVQDRGRRLRLSQAAVQVGGQIVVGTLKDYEARTVPLPSTVAVRLNSWVKGLNEASTSTQLVFSTRTGRHLHSQNWRRDTLDPASEAMGLSITAHHLRDTAATLAIAAGASVTAVARMLGHESAATTLRHYAGYFPDDLDIVANRVDAHAKKAEQRRPERAKAQEAPTPRRHRKETIS